MVEENMDVAKTNAQQSLENVLGDGREARCVDMN